MCYFFPISLLVLFLFSNSVFLSCFWYGLLIDLAVASLNQSMVSAKTMKVKKMHEQLGSQFIVFFVCLFVLVGLGYFFLFFLEVSNFWFEWFSSVIPTADVLLWSLCLAHSFHRGQLHEIMLF